MKIQVKMILMVSIMTSAQSLLAEPWHKAAWSKVSGAVSNAVSSVSSVFSSGNNDDQNTTPTNPKTTGSITALITKSRAVAPAAGTSSGTPVSLDDAPSALSTGLDNVQARASNIAKSLSKKLYDDVMIESEKSATVGNFVVVNSSSRAIEVVDDWRGHLVATQPALLDPKIELQYKLLETTQGSSTVSFPQDFMVEVPKTLLPLNGKKSFHDTAFLGAHNCFANLSDGFLYNQQGAPSVSAQINHGVRMLRPAFHNPSGSILDSPNREAILCHADDNKCGTVSLATRGFRPHQLVVNFNKLVAEVLKNRSQDIFVIGINNFLTNQQTDKEFERIEGLAAQILTPADLNNEENQKIWQGPWPTIDWMRSTGKRLVILNDDSTKYTLSYSDYVRRNMYGVKTVKEAAVPRGLNSLAMTEDPSKTLVEISWFQAISLPIYDQSVLEMAGSLYNDYLAKVPTLVVKAFQLPARLLSSIGLWHGSIPNPLQNFLDFLSMVASKMKYLLSLGLPSKLVELVKSNQNKINDVMKKIDEYKPIRQDNSFQTLQALIMACRDTKVLDKTQMPNIIMLDFVTTGGGLAMVNCLNMVKDQQLGLDFVDVGGFAYDGKLLNIDGLV